MTSEERQLYRFLQKLHKKHGSLRIIQAHYFPRASLPVISRAIKGDMPRQSSTRAALGLSCVVIAEPCPICGGTPVYCDNCAEPKAKAVYKYAYKRIAVRLDNPQSAAKTLLEHGGAEFVKELLSEFTKL